MAPAPSAAVHPLAAAACLLAMALAGCGSPSQAPEEGPASVPETSRLDLTDCTGWMAYSALLPPALLPGTAPAGWEPTAGDPLVANTVLAGYECQRVAVGPFERGPVRIVLDGHGNALVPPSCRALPSPSLLYVLNSVWVDDEGLAAFLAGALGMPAEHSSITASTQPAGAAAVHAWAWQDGRSTATVPDDGTSDSQSLSAQFLWERGNGIGSLALVGQRALTYPSDRAAVAAVDEPMLWASAPGGGFAGLSAWLSDLSAGGPIALYEDRLCRQEA